jgi:hypothetical protein
MAGETLNLVVVLRHLQKSRAYDFPISRTNYNAIATEVAKPVEDVIKYADVFWERYSEIAGGFLGFSAFTRDLPFEC